MCQFTCDDLQYKSLKILQSKQGYRSTEDSLILQKCILKNNDTNFAGNLFEFGTGCGIISILIASKIQNISITAIEVQKSLYKLAKENIKRCNLKTK